MGHGEHHQLVTDNLIDEAVGKAAGTYGAEGSGRGAAELGIGSEEREESMNLIEELGAETGGLSLIEARCVVEFSLGEWVELNRHSASRRRALASTVAAGIA
jgi:hypothetical protein